MDFFDENNDDYKDAKSEAFELASTDKKEAIKAAKNWIEEMLGKVPALVLKTKFLEFDSGNISHANAMWRVTMKGKPEQVLKFKKAYEEISG